jgi:16S rRNA (guanine966-N2)-methyltransferase
VRIIAGTYKGQRLAAPKRRSTRPTQDHIREAVFNLLGPVEGLNVLDLYAGSGALGIEALSRDATAATFVDSDARATWAVRQNLARLGVENARVARTDVLAFLHGAARRDERWDLVFCDPPYRLAHRLARDLDELLPPVLASEARVVCESSFRHPLELDLAPVTERRYGETVITIYSSSSRESGRAG